MNIIVLGIVKNIMAIECPDHTVDIKQHLEKAISKKSPPKHTFSAIVKLCKLCHCGGLRLKKQIQVLMPPFLLVSSHEK